MRIYLLCGRAGVGKNLIASILKEKISVKDTCLITEFSKYLKLYAKEMINYNPITDIKPRKFLQDMGSYIREELGLKDFLINRMIEDINIYQHKFNNIIICDVRLPEEIDKLKKKFSDVSAIHVISDNENKLLNDEEKNHCTEHALDNYDGFDYIIDNTNKNDIRIKIDKMMEELK